MWQKSFFYCKDTSPTSEDPLPGYRAERLVFEEKMKAFAKPAARAKLPPLLKRVKTLIVRGLTSLDLTQCWVSWHIQPLSIRNRLFCSYTGSTVDSMRYSTNTPTKPELIKMLKTLVSTPRERVLDVGLAPFSLLNPAPTVSKLLFYELIFPL